MIGDKISLAVCNARRLQDREHPQLSSAVKHIAYKLNFPTPEVYLYNQGIANCFTLGFSRKKAKIILHDEAPLHSDSLSCRIIEASPKNLVAFDLYRKVALNYIFSTVVYPNGRLYKKISFNNARAEKQIAM